MGLNNLNVKDLFDFLIRNYLGRYVTASPRFPASSLRQNSNSYYTRNPMTLRACRVDPYSKAFTV